MTNGRQQPPGGLRGRFRDVGRLAGAALEFPAGALEELGIPDLVLAAGADVDVAAVRRQAHGGIEVVGLAGGALRKHAADAESHALSWRKKIGGRIERKTRFGAWRSEKFTITSLPRISQSLTPGPCNCRVKEGR